MSMALHRLNQIEARILANHPRAVKDGELASLLSSLRDEMTAPLPPGTQYCACCVDNVCECCGLKTGTVDRLGQILLTQQEGNDHE